MLRLAAAILSVVLASPSWAGGMNGSFFLQFQSIPTLDEIGLAALIALVGGVAGWAIRRRGRR